MAHRPDHSKKELPGYRRAGPKEVPKDVKIEADGIIDTLSWDTPKGTRTSWIGETFTPSDPALASYKLLIEKHAEGKIGVSVFVKE